MQASAGQKHLVIIAGPTAVGKTAVAIRLAQHYGTSIISADSRQCYREMTIGTAKPSEEELHAAKHYFINTHSVHEALNAGDFEALALGYAADIFQHNDIAIVSGGTGLYIKALCEGIDPMPLSDPEIESRLQSDFSARGLEWLQQTVASEDPEFYAIAEIMNPSRLIRALAFKRSTGSSITKYRSGQKKARFFKTIKIALEIPRPELYERIDTRVDQMMAEGLWEEAAELYPFRNLKNLQTVGYSEIFDCMEGKISRDEAIALIKQHSRNYAKRQLTWFKKDKEFSWFAPADTDLIISRIEGERLP